ncbi:hypothetical protein ACQP2P_14950 [Dactylosporangium sp. CA-139114]|uniref:hypothetical protein n=1 Tax=Dactylosporangium sp. CA-139114 TaxID=3239931 RepID=UPI003D97B8D5
MTGPTQSTAECAPAVAGVALLDRFEAVRETGTRSAFDATQRLALYDLRADRRVTVADGVDQVASNGHLPWRSTGDRRAATWHSLDLSILVP